MLKRLSHTFCLLFIIIAPVSYDVNDKTAIPDSTFITLTAGGGTGHYVSVLESCSGPRRITEDDFHDLGAALEIKPEANIPLVVGLRAGHINSAVGNGAGHIDNGYLNPHIAFETRYIGLGVGLVRNLGPLQDPDFIDLDADFRQEKNFPSGHLRAGQFRSIYFIGAFNEGVPIASEYGYLLLGMGYGGVPRWDFKAGVSAGFYSQPGFYAATVHSFTRRTAGTFSFRIGRSHHISEGGVSVGLTYSIK